MIAASEPVEFIPRGRQAVEEHPGPILPNQKTGITSEHLWHRLQHVNISSDENSREFWSVRELYEECGENTMKDPQSQGSRPGSPSYMADFYVNSEEELYVKGNTAVWTKGLHCEDSVLPRVCFTCDYPIKFAFFCHENFISARKVSEKSNEVETKRETAICLIDSTSLRVYCNNGEDYQSNLEFPVSNVWQTKYGIILEKEASSTMIQTQSISMPRFFSLSHPLEEMCPILNKPNTGQITYLTEADYKVIFSTYDSDLVLLYDKKVGKHFVAKLRKATEEEIHFVGCANETSGNNSSRAGTYSFSQNSLKLSGFAKNSTSILARSSLGNTGHNSHIGKFLNSTASPQSANNPMSNFNRSNIQSPLTRLQSSLGPSSMSIQDIRKIGQCQPSKPLVPEYCLEHIWAENVVGKDFCEIASTAFMHTDLIGQTYLCYLLNRSCKLYLVRLEKSSTPNTYIFGKISSIAAKDAVTLEKMKMIAVLGPCGTLMLYTGPVLVSKVHVAEMLTSVISQNAGSSFGSSFPRRSSLLPSIQPSVDTPFDDELHMLSPVHPLQPQFPNRPSNLCLSLRDPAGNRLTLMYPEGRMYRVTLPLVNETHFITKCLTALRQVLKKDLSIQLFAKWYGARNAPGSQDFSSEQEWETFRNVFSELLGRTVSSNESNSNHSCAEEPKKRRKGDDVCGTDDDWEYLEHFLNNESDKTGNGILHNDNSAPLFPYIPIVFYTLHVLYEEIKLDSSMTSYLKYLAEFLYELAYDMQLSDYCMHYFLDFPHLLQYQAIKFFTKEDALRMQNVNLLREPVPNIYRQINSIIKNRELMRYPCIPQVNKISRNIIQLVSLICHGCTKIKNWINIMEFPGTASSERPKGPKRFITTNIPRSEQVIQMLLNMDMSRTDVERLPSAIHYIVAQSLEYSRLSPPTGISYKAYELLLRSELVTHARSDNSAGYASFSPKTNLNKEDSLSPRVPPPPNAIPQAESAPQEEDGMENVDTKLLRLRFPDDLRTTEVRRILNSSEAVLIEITQSPGVSDHEFIEEQEKQLYALCTRTMTLPMGRGMFTLRTMTPTPTESMPIPKLCLSGKEPVKGASIEMQQIEFPPNMALWPSFHNGVAAGLRISPHAKDIDSTWIVYNKPKGQSDVSTEHAGFLMALGLNGHLKTLSFMSIYEYLVKCDEMTSVGLLLGISAAHRGTMDSTTTKLLSVHIEALLPATALELDIPQNIQVASLMGIGLIYQGTAKRHIAEVLLQEIGRPPGPEMENSVERESYALTAGLALGLVTLGQGESPAGLRDLQLPDTLHYYMVGGNKRLLTGSQKEKYKLPSFQVREGDAVNIDVTAPGATLALGLMFFKTGNTAVAQWMRPPDTSYLLDLIRPDLLLLRIIARGLILWDDIEPSSEWLFSQFPASLEFDLKRGPEDNSVDIDHEANAQAYCNIITGAAFCIGLKYAGTENPIAFKTLRKTIKLFLSMNGQYVGEYAGKATVESCLILILISLSLVYAGTGDLEILRIIRFLRSRIGPSHPQVTYGSHMGIHMALGFLFLGAGRYTLSRSPEAIAALVCSLFPKFPNHSNDNRYHLQAFRHFYVLAVEPRLFLPRDIDTGKLCLCQISCIEIGSDELKNLPMAPCMLPELNTLKVIKVNDVNYWPVSFERGRNWDQLVKILNNSGCIDIKKRAGCLSHLEDPDRLKSLLAQTLTTEQYSCWKIEPKFLLTFSNDATVVSFTEKFLEFNKSKQNISKLELARSQLLVIVFYNCLTKDKMHALPIYLSLLDALERIRSSPNNQDIWQFKIIQAYQQLYNDDILVSNEILASTVQRLISCMEEWRTMYQISLKQFISTPNIDMFRDSSLSCLRKITGVITFYDLVQNSLNLVDLTGNVNYLRILYEFKKLNFDVNTINCIGKLLNMS